jgi:glycosyltransferase involved in cell wall biosynthesis
VPEVRDLDHVISVPPALLNPRFYAPVQREWPSGPLRVVFAGDGSPRKGIDIALAAFDSLSDGFEFEVVGPHAHRATTLARPSRVAFHGWLDPRELRAVFRRCHVMVSPVRTEPDGHGGKMIDGFPTTTAASAMSTGCLLVSGNPRADHSVLTPGRTHVELENVSAGELAGVLVGLLADRDAAAAIAAEGQRVARAELDVFGAMRSRLDLLGLL